MMCERSLNIRQKIIAAKVSQGWYAPHVPYVHEVDVSNILYFLSKINSNNTSSKITLNTLLVYVIVNAIKSCPAVNAHIYYNRRMASGYVEFMESIDINMPVLLPDGKMTAIKLIDFGNKKLREMQDYIRNVMEKIRASDMEVPLMKTALNDTFKMFLKGDVISSILRLLGLRVGRGRIRRIPLKKYNAYNSLPKDDRVLIDELSIGTVLITNLGAALKNIRGFPALVSLLSPQVFSVGIGSIYDEPVISKEDDKEVAVSTCKKIKFCYTFDHRALDFGDIIPFIKRVDDILKDPDSYIELN